MPLLDPAVIDRQDKLRTPAAAAEEARARRQQLLKRAELLLPEDRALVHLALTSGASHRQISALTKCAAGSVSRRLQRLGARLTDPLVVALLSDTCPLPDDYRQLGIEHFLQGRSMSELSDLHRMSLNEVRRSIAYIRGWHRGITTARSV